MKYLEFKSNKNIYATQESNNFGDQIIKIGNHKIIGSEKIIFSDTNHEGSWIDFNEKTLIKLLKLK